MGVNNLIELHVPDGSVFSFCGFSETPSGALQTKTGEENCVKNATRPNKACKNIDLT